MLQLLHGGATARPFVTRSNALDIDLYLRIAPELFLKRCVAGGVDSSHSPGLRRLRHRRYPHPGADPGGGLRIDRVARGSHVVRHHDGAELDPGGEWRSLTLFGALSDALGVEVGIETPTHPVDEIRGRAPAPGCDGRPVPGPGKLAEEIVEALVVPSLIEPTFVRDHPVETSPLTREHRSTPDLPRNGISTSAASSWRRDTPSWWIRWYNGSVWRRSRCWLRGISGGDAP